MYRFLTVHLVPHLVVGLREVAEVLVVQVVLVELEVLVEEVLVVLDPLVELQEQLILDPGAVPEDGLLMVQQLQEEQVVPAS